LTTVNYITVIRYGEGEVRWWGSLSSHEKWKNRI